MSITKSYKNILILLVFSLILFVSGNGILSLTNPDEVFYAQTGKEMLQQHSWMTPYLFGKPQFEKPIFTFWLLRIAFAIFGISSFSARLFPSIFATLGVLCVYFLGLLGFKNERKAMFSALILMSSSFYIAMAKTILTDMIFSVFILLSLTLFLWGYLYQEKRSIGILLFFVFAGLATLTKGPLGILIPLITVILFLVLRRDIKYFLSRDFLGGVLVFCLISLPWYIFMIKKYGSVFTYEFFYNDHFRRLIEAEHISNDTWYFYLLSMLASMFPWSLYTFFSFVHLRKRLKQNSQSMNLMLCSWIVSVFLIFQVAHSKLVSYILPLLPALALITGNFVFDTLAQKKSRFFFFLSLMITLFLFLIPVGLITASHIYSIYLSSPMPIYIFSFIFVIYIISLLFFILKSRFSMFIYLLLLSVPMILFFVLSLHNDFESYVSSKEGSKFLVNNYKIDNKILCSKFFARGVRYYSDKEVAVIDINRKGFFSPHPIEVLSSEEKIKKFLHRQTLTYCVIKAKDFRRIQRIISEEFSYDSLGIFGDEHLLRIKRK